MIIRYTYCLPWVADASLLAPIPDIPVHVKQPKIVRFLASHRPSSIFGIVQIPSILPQQLITRSVIATGHCPRTNRILPFRFRGKTIPWKTQVSLLQFRYLALWSGFIASLFRGNPFLLTQPVAVLSGFVPVHASY